MISGQSALSTPHAIKACTAPGAQAGFPVQLQGQLIVPSGIKVLDGADIRLEQEDFT
jgi:hypothetical protein